MTVGLVLSLLSLLLLLCTALLERQQLFAPEGLVMNLSGGFDQILQMRSSQKVS